MPLAAPLKLWMTLPSWNQDSTSVCHDTIPGTPLTDLKEIQVLGWRFSGTDTIPIGAAQCAGMEGDSLGIEFDIEPGSMGELLVAAVDFSGNRSCSAHYVFAVQAEDAPPPTTTPLTAQYFNNVDFSGLFDVLQKDVIDETFPSPPLPGMGVGSFSVRWIGEILAPETGTYTIRDNGCGGFRLAFASSPLMEYTGAGCGETARSVGLTAGDRYVTILEYWSSAEATARNGLLWTKPDGTTEVIPAQAWR
jgi:hypothetical protein